MSGLKPVCPQCGAALNESAAGGLCPNCLMALNFQTETVLTGDAKQSEAPLPPDAITPHFPQLEILECLGRGGMGVVYKARQKTLNRLVALKLLAPERVNDAKFAERFTREAQALAALNHPNIVTIHDFGQAGGFYYLLMEYVDGLNLRQLLRGRKFTPEEALTIIPPLCDALQFAHDRGIVHRDIKPENLLLDKNGRIKVADFGIARMLGTTGGAGVTDSSAGENATRSAIGTPAYSAPEQKNDPQRVDSRADIYSLGVVFYEMLTGELPGKRIEAPSRKVLVDVRLDEIVLRALEQEPELRFQHASAFKTQVEMVADHPRPKKTADDYSARAFAFTGSNWEYKSKGTIFGMPLVHVSNGIDPSTGKARVSRGFLAIGQIAKGVFAFGGRAYGVFALGGIAVGVFAFGGLALGMFGIGGLVAALWATGGMVSGVIAVGGQSFGWIVPEGTGWGAHHFSTKFLMMELAVMVPVVLLLALSCALVPILTVRWAKQKMAEEKTGAKVRPAPEAFKEPTSGKIRGEMVSPFASQQAREIGRHLTKGEKSEAALHGLMWGVWIAAVFFGVQYFIRTFPAPGNWIVALVLALLFIASISPMLKMQKRFMASTEWAKQQGYTAEGIKLFSASGKNILRCGVFLVIGAALVLGQWKLFNHMSGMKELTESLDQMSQREGKSNSGGTSTVKSDYIGQSYFPWGDSIEVEEVRRTAEEMVVKGHYRLTSLNRATLGLHITSTNKSGARDGAQQSREITKGEDDFILVYPRPIAGMPHVTMYSQDGRSFATLYFGTEEEALRERNVHLSDPPMGSRPEGSRFTAKLNKATVELLGVNNSGMTNLAWLPDGTAMTNDYRILHRSTSNGRFGFGMALAINDWWIYRPIGCVAHCYTKAGKQMGFSTSWDPGHGIMEITESEMNPQREPVNVSVGVANGPWSKWWSLNHQPEQLSAAGTDYTTNRQQVITSYDFVKMTNDVMLLSCLYPVKEDRQTRMVMVADTGIVTEVTDAPSQSLQLMRSAVMMVTSNDFAHVTELQVQERPYRWASFHNVSVQQGEKTDVQILTGGHPE